MKKNVKKMDIAKFVFGWDGKNFVYSAGETKKLLATNDLQLINFFRKENQEKLTKLLLQIYAEERRYLFTKQNDYVVDPTELPEDECRAYPVMASELLPRPEEKSCREEICKLFPAEVAAKIAKSKRPMWKKLAASRKAKLDNLWESCFGHKF